MEAETPVEGLRRGPRILRVDPEYGDARVPADDSEYSRFALTMAEQGVPIQLIGAGDELRFGDVRAEVLWPPPAKEPPRFGTACGPK